MRNFPRLKPGEVLKSLQSAVVVSADQEAIDFLVASALAKIWKHAFRDENAAVAQARAFKETLTQSGCGLNF